MNNILFAFQELASLLFGVRRTSSYAKAKADRHVRFSTLRRLTQKAPSQFSKCFEYNVPSLDLVLSIDLKALVANYHRVQREVGPACHVAAVVKANAYGLGIKEVATALTYAGCQTFCVATLREAIELRAIIPNVKIVIFHGIANQEELRLCLEYDLIPVINTKETLHYAQLLPCIVHIDTGMNRLGISMQELDAAKGVPCEWIMTHPSCADIPTAKQNELQLMHFEQASQFFPSAKRSYANSYAIFASKSMHYDMVRPGCCLYGINPTPGQKNPMQPVVTLTARILQIRHIDTPGAVGYGAEYHVKEGSVIATVGCGYADGYLRSAGNNARVFLHGVYVPVVGRVSMDLMTIDVTTIASDVGLGDEVELFGKHVTVDDLADAAGTIGYEILTRLGSRCERRYQ